MKNHVGFCISKYVVKNSHTALAFQFELLSILHNIFGKVTNETANIIGTIQA
jgi:hypothetical protein